MSDPITAAMVGAGVGGGTSLLRGKSLGSSLKNAAIGGALGGGGSYLGGLMGGAGGATGGTTGAVEGSIGTELVFNPATGTYLNPEYFVGAGGSMPLFTGGGNALSQIGTGLSSFGGAAMDSIKANPFPAAGLGMSVYDKMNQSQAPLQPSPMQNAQQLIGQQSPVPVPQFNSLLQASRRPILIG